MITLSAKSVIAATVENKNQSLFAIQKLKFLPPQVQTRIARQYANTYKASEKSSQLASHQVRNEAYKAANKNLIKSTNRIKFKPLFGLLTDIKLPFKSINHIDTLKDTAKSAVNECMQGLQYVSQSNVSGYENKLESAYEALMKICINKGIQAPFSTSKHLSKEHYEIALLKMQCDDWWIRKLKRYRAHVLEHLEIATGEVNKHTNPYASRFALNEFLSQKKKMMRIYNRWNW